MVSKEIKNRIRVLSSLETNIVSGAKFGSRFWGKPKIVDEVGNCK
jgi:hypothetical protein